MIQLILDEDCSKKGDYKKDVSVSNQNTFYDSDHSAMFFTQCKKTNKFSFSIEIVNPPIYEI